jgi:hypothetical protein
MQELGAIGEFVGGIAVIATLIYLVVQIRQNNRMNASLIRQNFYNATQTQILHAVESTEFNDLVHRGWGTNESLTDGEKVQIWRHMQGILMGYQGAFEQYKSGVLPEKDWALARHMLRTFWLLEGKGRDEAWEMMRNGRFFNEDFMEELECLRDEAFEHKKQLEENNFKGQKH